MNCDGGEICLQLSEPLKTAGRSNLRRVANAVSPEEPQCRYVSSALYMCRLGLLVFRLGHQRPTGRVEGLLGSGQRVCMVDWEAQEESAGADAAEVSTV